MCIICNMGSDHTASHIASSFLAAYGESQLHMASAAAFMLKCSQLAVDAEDRKRYDAIHKQIVRLQREWNKLEHLREGHGAIIAPQLP